MPTFSVNRKIFSLLVLAIPCAFRLAMAQPASDCIQSSLLWLPSTDTKVISKWRKDLTFAVDVSGAGVAAATSVESVMKSISRQTGLEIGEDGSEAESTDILIIVDQNLSTDAPMLREKAKTFFNGHFRVPGHVSIDPDAWDMKMKSVSPKCAGLEFEVNHEKDLAFVAIQSDADLACIRIGLGQAFGLINIRDYYARKGEAPPEEQFEGALHQLYSHEIRSGMTRVEARRHIDEVCTK